MTAATAAVVCLIGAGIALTFCLGAWFDRPPKDKK